MRFCVTSLCALRPSKRSGACGAPKPPSFLDRKSTRLNSSHSQISYAVFCLKKKKNKADHPDEERGAEGEEPRGCQQPARPASACHIHARRGSRERRRSPRVRVGSFYRSSTA